MYKLDFNITSSEDRCNFVRNIDLTQLSPKDLETCANYILYGKDEDGTSSVDRKEIEIKTKFSSYSKKIPVSLDSLLESPTFNENIIIKKDIYKKVKPSIDKEQVKNIKGMKELWEEIDKLQRILDENTGKIEKTTSTPNLDTKQIYYLKHQIIELRRQQYYLKDSEFPTIPLQPNRFNFYSQIQDEQMNYWIFPRGTMTSEHDKDFCSPRKDPKPSKPLGEDKIKEIKNNSRFYFDFREKEHIYQLILFYWDLKMSIEKLPDSPLHGLLWTLDFYIEKANLSPQQKLIVEDKKLRLLNKEISKHLEEELGITHQENYISTIWNKCCELICAAAELNYDEWICKDYDKAWKKCTSCGEELLRDNRNFVKKSKASDGLTSKCKKCDKITRQIRKGK